MTRPLSKGVRKLDAAKLTALLSHAQDNPSIQTLSVRNEGLTPNLAVQIADFLETNQSITELDLSGNNIGSHGACCIAASLCKNRTIRYLNLSKCGLQGDSIPPFVEYFKTCGSSATLQKITLSNNQIDDEAAGHVAELVESAAVLSPQAFELDLRDNDLSDPSIKSIATAIQKNHAITSMRLEGNQEDDAYVALQQIQFCLQRNAREGTRRLFLCQLDAIRDSSISVETCHLDYSDLTLHDSRLLADALCTNRSITAFRLRDNGLPEEGVRRIMNALALHQSLRRLELVDVDCDWISVNQLLSSSPTLDVLSVRYSGHASWSPPPPSRLACAALHHTFASGRSPLRSLSFVNCGLTDLEIGVIVSGIAIACRMEQLDVRNNAFTDHGLQVFSRLLHRCASLWSLDVGGNQLSLADVTSLAQAASTHPSLRVLRLGRCSEYDRSVIAEICGQLKRSKTLVEFEYFTKSNASKCAELVRALHQEWSLRRREYHVHRQRKEAQELTEYSSHAKRLTAARQAATTFVSELKPR